LRKEILPKLASVKFPEDCIYLMEHNDLVVTSVLVVHVHTFR